MRSAGNVLRLHGTLAAAGLLAIVGAVAVLARLITFASPSPAALADACRGFVLPTLTPSVLLLAATAGLIAATITRGATSAGRQALGSRRVTRALAHAAHPLDGHPRAWTYADRRPAAFCAGLLRPRVFVSSQVVRALDPAELRAVIAHETHHVDRRDPLRLFVTRTLADGLFFLPVLRRLTDRYADLAELDADQAAVRRSEAGPGPLAAAMLVLAPTPAVAGVLPERVDGLLGLPPRDDVPVAALTVGLLALAAVLGAVATTADVTGHAGITLNVPTLAAQGCMVATGTGTIAALTFGALAIVRLGRVALSRLRT